MATHNTNFPLLDEMSLQCWTRTPEQKEDEEELMMMEWLRSMHPEQLPTAVHQLVYGRWLDSKPNVNNHLPY